MLWTLLRTLLSFFSLTPTIHATIIRSRSRAMLTEVNTITLPDAMCAVQYPIGSTGCAYCLATGTTRFYDIDCMDASELLLVTGNYIYLAQKSALAQKSTYFKRAFEGKFPVAHSKTFDLGAEDHPTFIHAMLRFLHGVPYAKLHDHGNVGRSIDHHVDMYLIGDQYDIPTLRAEAAETFYLEGTYLAPTNTTIGSIQRVLGIEGLVLADKALEEQAMQLVVDELETLLKNEEFAEKLHTGVLLHPMFVPRLLFGLGDRIKGYKGEGLWKPKRAGFHGPNLEPLAAGSLRLPPGNYFDVPQVPGAITRPAQPVTQPQPQVPMAFGFPVVPQPAPAAVPGPAPLVSVPRPSLPQPVRAFGARVGDTVTQAWAQRPRFKRP